MPKILQALVLSLTVALLSIPLRASGLNCVPSTAVGYPCNAASCSLSQIWADQQANPSRAEWTGTGCTGNGYDPVANGDNILGPDGKTWTMDSWAGSTLIKVGPCAAPSQTTPAVGPAAGIFTGTTKLVIPLDSTVVLRGGFATGVGLGGVAYEQRGTLAFDSTCYGDGTSHYQFYPSNAAAPGAWVIIGPSSPIRQPARLYNGVIRGATAAETGTVASKPPDTFGHSSRPVPIYSTDAVITAGGTGTDNPAVQLVASSAMRFTRTLFTGGGHVKLTVGAATDLQILNNEWRDSTLLSGNTADGNALKVNENAAMTTGTRLIANNWVVGTYYVYASNVTESSNAVETHPEGSTDGLNTTQSCTKTGFVNYNGHIMTDMFVYDNRLKRWIQGGNIPASGTVTDLMVLEHAALDNPHLIDGCGIQDAARTVQKYGIEHNGPQASGDSFSQPGQTTNYVATYKNGLYTAQLNTQSTLTAWLTSTNVNWANIRADIQHITFASHTAGEPGMGAAIQFTQSGAMTDPIMTIKNSTAFWPVKDNIVPISYNGGAPPTGQQAGEIGPCDYNASVNTNDPSKNYWDTENVGMNIFTTPPGVHDFVNVDPLYPDINWLYIKTPTQYLGWTGTAWTAGTSEAHQNYAVKDVVLHSRADFAGGAAILWECIRAHDAYTTGASSEPGNPSGTVVAADNGTAGDLTGGNYAKYWKPLVVDLVAESAVLGTKYYNAAFECSAGCSLNQLFMGIARAKLAPQNASYWCSGDDGDTRGIQVCREKRLMMSL